MEAAVNWIGTRHGGEYAGPAAIVAALAGHQGSQDMLAERLRVQEVTFEQLASTLDTEFFPAMIWLCAGMVATLGEGDVAWLRQHRGTGT